MYDSQIGRFITEDPIQDSINWYVYCGNNPVIFVDILGLAITKKDIEAYQSGKMSKKAWEMLNDADKMWNNSKYDDYTTKAIAHNMAYVARSTYSDEIDNFDYTFGTGYQAIDFGDSGKHMKVAYVTSSDGKYTGTVFLYYERFINNEKSYIKILGSSGYSYINTRSSIYADGIEYMYGATEWLGSNRKKGKISSNQYNIDFEGINIIPDDGGVYHTAGINVTFKFSTPRQSNYTLVVTNNVYETYTYNEKGEFFTEAQIPDSFMDGRTYYYDR